MAYQDNNQDPRNPNNRPHLGNLTPNERGFAGDAGRAFPTTPSTFPQPVYPSQNGQQEVWGQGQPPPSQYQGGPPSYFVQHVNFQQQNYSPNQALTPNSSGYRTPGGGYNDGTNGLVHQFSNLGAASSPRSASPYGRVGTPTGGGPRTPGVQATNQGQQAHLAPSGYQSQSGSFEEELPAKNPEKYADNIYRRAKHSTDQVGTFFRENVQRAKERNQRYAPQSNTKQH